MSNLISLSNTQFNTLIDAIKNSGGGGGDSKIEYDLEEHEIGTWFGKPLYQKTYKSTITRSSITLLDFNLTNLDIQELMFDWTGGYLSLNGTKQGIIVPLADRKENYDLINSIEYNPNTHTLTLKFNNTWVATTGTMFIVFTIRYTKNSDEVV